MNIEDKLFWINESSAFMDEVGRLDTMRTYDAPLDESEETLAEFGNEIDFFSVEDISNATIDSTRITICGETYVRLIEGYKL